MDDIAAKARERKFSKDHIEALSDFWKNNHARVCALDSILASYATYILSDPRPPNEAKYLEPVIQGKQCQERLAQIA